MKSNFRLPGPTAVPPQVYDAMQREMVPHRGAEFVAFYRSMLERLQRIHKTESDVLVWPGSGSAGWEIAITNFLSPGDETVALVAGEFGDRFALVAGKLGVVAHRVELPWGSAFHPEILATALGAHPGAKAVCLTHNETSTGVTHPIGELAAVARERVMLTFVDGVSSVAGIPVDFDGWDIDYMMSGSQKAWMCPPGVTIAAIGPRAWDAYERSTFPKFFWDAGPMREMSAQGITPTTPPVSLDYALDTAAQMIEAEGLEHVFARHADLGAQTRAGIEALGLELVAEPGFESNTVTAVQMPGGLSAKLAAQRLLDEHGVTVATGQSHLADRIIRIGHMGWVDSEDMDNCLAAVKAVLG
ncbi:MAG: alanine--glyoxylate aminotransferase family protein [Thermomicrobiales bacterium]|nr:alanine--glyoxylate aminotransferase family protein [Thermomicrobiales bacterium]